MANQTPLSSVNAAGGYLIQPEYAQTLLSRIARENAVFQLADTTRINTNQMIWPVYLGRPTAAFVAEAGTKPVTGAEFGQLTANIKKIATKIRFTDEILADAVQDPRILTGPDVVSAINDLAEYNALGTHAGAADTTATFTTSFDSALLNTTSGGAHVEYVQANQDALATAISAAIAKLEANGYANNLGILAGYRVKQALRDARATTGQPLYTDSFSADVPGLYGLRWAFSTNLNRTAAGVYDPITTAGLIGGAASPGRVVALVGDFSNAKAVIREDVRVDSTKEAYSSGVSLWDTNMTELRYETRIGFQVYDLNNAFVKIVNAA